MLMVAFTAVEKHTLHKGGIYMDIKYVNVKSCALAN